MAPNRLAFLRHRRRFQCRRVKLPGWCATLPHRQRHLSLSRPPPSRASERTAHPLAHTVLSTRPSRPRSPTRLPTAPDRLTSLQDGQQFRLRRLRARARPAPRTGRPRPKVPRRATGLLPAHLMPAPQSRLRRPQRQLATSPQPPASSPNLKASRSPRAWRRLLCHQLRPPPTAQPLDRRKCHWPRRARAKRAGGIGVGRPSRSPCRGRRARCLVLSSLHRLARPFPPRPPRHPLRPQQRQMRWLRRQVKPRPRQALAAKKQVQKNLRAHRTAQIVPVRKRQLGWQPRSRPRTSPLLLPKPITCARPRSPRSQNTCTRHGPIKASSLCRLLRGLRPSRWRTPRMAFAPMLKQPPQ